MARKGTEHKHCMIKREYATKIISAASGQAIPKSKQGNQQEQNPLEVVIDTSMSTLRRGAQRHKVQSLDKIIKRWHCYKTHAKATTNIEVFSRAGILFLSQSSQNKPPTTRYKTTFVNERKLTGHALA